MNKAILCTLVLVIGTPLFAHADESTSASDDTSQTATASAPPPVIATPTVKFYGLFDIGYVGRSGGNGLVPEAQNKNDIQSGAGSGGSRFGVSASEPIGAGFTAIGEAEFGYNQQGGDDDVKGAADFINRHSWVGITNASYGTLIGGKLDGARASLIRDFDPFQGAGVASGGSLQLVTTRADDAVAYVSPTIKGLNLIVAYTTNLFGVAEHSAQTPVYATVLTYVLGDFKISFDREQEWWHYQPGLNVLRVYDTGISYDFHIFKLFGVWDRITVAEPYDPTSLGFFGDHQGFEVGATVPVATNGMVKIAWTRSDSRAINNTCDKYGIGYQHNFTKQFYAYGDIAHIINDAGGSCTIAYTTEQTSNDLGSGYAGGYGTSGVDAGIVFKF